MRYLLPTLLLFLLTLSPIRAHNDVTVDEVDLRATVEAQRGNLHEKITQQQEQVEVLLEKKAEVQEKMVSVKDEAFKKIREHFLQSVERLSEYLGNATEKVNSSQGLTDSQKQDLLAEIATYQSRLSEFKSQIEAAETIEEIRDVAPSLRDIHKIIRRIAHKRNAYHLVNRFEIFANRLDEAIVKIQAKIDELANQGIDTTQAQSHLDTASTNLDEAENLMDEAFNLASSINGQTENAQEIFVETRHKLGEAKRKLRDTHLSLKQAVLSLRTVIRESKTEIKK